MHARTSRAIDRRRLRRGRVFRAWQRRVPLQAESVVFSGAAKKRSHHRAENNQIDECHRAECQCTKGLHFRLRAKT